MKIDAEKLVLIVFFTFLLFVGPGTLFDHRIQHDFPYAYSASDAFQHQIRTESIKDMGNFKYEATYISKGFEKVEGRYPPVMYHIGVILSYASGLETYDTTYFVVVFFMSLSVLVMYMIIRQFNKKIALLSLPLPLLLFYFPVSLGITWGHWPALLAQSFLVLFFWIVMRMDLPKSYLLIGVGMSIIALTHTSEVVFGVIFLAIFLGTKFLVKKLSFNDIKVMLWSLIPFLILSTYYLIIFQLTWAAGDTFEWGSMPIWRDNHGFYINGFGLLLLPLLAGIVLGLFQIKKLHIALICGYAMLLIGYFNYIGFGFRSFQVRFFWPLYLSVFVGLGLYFVGKRLNKKIILGIVTLLCIFIAGFISLPIYKQTQINIIPYIPQLQMQSNQGMMDAEHWQVFNWLAENVPEEERIYFFFGTIYDQDAVLRNSKRTHYLIQISEMVESIQERQIKREYFSELPGDSGGGVYTRTSFFTFEPYWELDPENWEAGDQDICNFNYVVFDKDKAQPAFIQYNMLVANELVQNDFISVVFENPTTIILKNNNVGEECIVEKTF